MGGYRDDLGAAVARADALQHEVDELKAELERLRKGQGMRSPTLGVRHSVGAYAALGAMLLFVAAMVLLLFGQLVPGRAPDRSVYVEFEAPR